MSSQQIFSTNEMACWFRIHHEKQRHVLQEMENLVHSVWVIDKSKQPWQQGIVVGIKPVTALLKV